MGVLFAPTTQNSYLCSLIQSFSMKRKTMRRYFFIIWALLCFSSVTVAQEHTKMLGISLDLSPDEVVRELCNKGLQQEDTYLLSGRIAGLRIWVKVSVSKDSTRVNHVLVTTQEQQGRSQRDDYAVMKRWMQKHYGEPTWESTVRSHPFARWFVDFDHDIVMIATAKTAVEVYFYENHDYRNFDYYAILKYCERNPVDEVPYFTAQESVTWKNNAPRPVAKKKMTKRQLRKASAKKQKGKAPKTKGRKAKGSKAKSRKRRR